MRCFALVLVLCTGCDQLFDIHSIDIPHVDGGPSDAPADTQPSGPLCSPMSMLADDFTIDDLATMWPETTALSANQVVVVGAQLEIQNLSVDSYATLDAGRFYDLTDGAFSARITDDGHMDGSDFVQLELFSSVGYDLKIERDASNVNITYTAPQNNPVKIASFPYDAATMQYFRVANLAGVMTIATSQEGSAYTPVATVPYPQNYTFLRPTIQAHRGISSPEYTVYVDDVDGGTPRGTACAVAQLHDDFSGTSIGSQWARSEMYGGTLTDHDGIADLSTTGAGSIVGLAAGTIYDMTNGELFVELPVLVASNASNSVELRVTTGAGDWFSWFETQGMLIAGANFQGGATTVANLVYSPATMRWWKMASAAGVVQFATSSDGVTWTTLPNSLPQLQGIERCDIRLTVSSSSNVASDTQADNFNVHP